MQTETYQEAVVGIKMAIIHRHHRDVKMDQIQNDIIQEKLSTPVNTNPSEEIPPQFRCEVLSLQRYNVLGELTTEPNDTYTATVRHLCLFTRNTGLSKLC